jgi:uncharacterized lipoprotein YmbA
MKTKHLSHQFLIAGIAAAMAGCASAPSQFYTLNSTATEGSAPAASYAIVVGPVSVPALVDRPQFTVQVATNRVVVDEFNRWAEPLNESIGHAVAGDLATLLGTSLVTTKPLANFDPAYRVTIDIQRFESARGPTPGTASVVVEAVWVVRRVAGGPPRSGHTVAGESAQGDGFDALAAAHSRALAKVSGDIASAIRAQADEK